MVDFSAVDDSGFQLLQIIIIISISVLCAFFIFSYYTISYIKENWNDSRCRPEYMMFAGWLGYDADENYRYCLNEQNKDIQKHTKKKTKNFFNWYSFGMKKIRQITVGAARKLDQIQLGNNQILGDVKEVIDNIKSIIIVAIENLTSLLKKLLALGSIIILTITSSVTTIKGMQQGTLGAITALSSQK